MADLQLSVVLPTFNEAENVPIIVERLAVLLKNVRHEIIVSDDDSPDKTWEVAEGLRERYPQVRVLRRRGERGLYPAVAEAFDGAGGAALAVLDALGAFCDTAASGAPAMMLPTSADTNFAVRLPILVSRLRMTQL